MELQQAAAAAGADPILAAFQQVAQQGQSPHQQWASNAASEQGDALGGSGTADGADGDTEEDEESQDAGAVDDADDSDYNDEEEEEEEGGRRGRGRRGGSGSGSGSESESDPDYTEGPSASKRRRARTPPGARRSVRIKDRGIDPVQELEDEAETTDLAPRRGLRSAGPLAASAAPLGEPAGAGVVSRSGSEAPGAAQVPPTLPSLGGLPNPKDIRREFTQEQMAADLAEIKGMWEMAAILDFFNLFKRQLNLSRTFAASELEHVLSFSDGRDGLLADLHIDIMRGISPKQDVPRDAWAVHLANKIKYHWRPLLSGLHCPFKPDKYFEAYTYARLPASDRVRALHFLCTIRCDREDIQFRVAESYMREWTKGEVALVLQGQAEAVRNGRPEDAPQADFSPEVFRRQPNGLDRAGCRYYVFNMFHGKEFRMYKETPAAVLPATAAGGTSADATAQVAAAAAAVKPENTASASAGEGAHAGAAAPAANGAPAASAGVVIAEEPQQQAAAQQDGSFGYDSEDSWDAREARLRHYQVPPDPEQEPGWELVAATLEEFTDYANRFGASDNQHEAQFSLIIRQYVIPVIVQMREEEERRAKAAERVQRKLGVPAPGAAPAAAVASGSGGSGAVAGPTRSAAAVQPPADGGRDTAGRSRRSRARVNYAFNDYDEQLRSAIRQTQRGEEESDDDDGSGRRRRRRVPSPSGDPVEAARGGLRRGRSAAAIKGDIVEVNNFLDERQLRAAVAYRGSRASSRAASRVGSGIDLAQMSEQAAEQQAGTAPDEVQQNGAEQEADASAFVTATGKGSGRRGGTRKKPARYQDEDEESEPDAGADAMSEDEYVPGRR